MERKMRHITTYGLYESSENYDYNGIIYITEGNAIGNMPCTQYWFYINDQSYKYKYSLKISSVGGISIVNDWISDFLSLYTWFETSNTEWSSSIELYNKPNNILAYGLTIDNMDNLNFGDEGDDDILYAFDEFKKRLDLEFDLVKVEKVYIESRQPMVVDVLDHWSR